MRFHDLRHPAATDWLKNGMHQKVASERLGHASVGITLDLYSHVTPTMQPDAVAEITRKRSARKEGRLAPERTGSAVVASGKHDVLGLDGRAGASNVHPHTEGPVEAFPSKSRSNLRRSLYEEAAIACQERPVMPTEMDANPKGSTLGQHRASS